MARIWLTKNQVVAWCDDWTDADRAKVAAAIDALGDIELYTTPSGSYCASQTYGERMTGSRLDGSEGWRRGFVIYRNRIEWLYGEGTQNLDPVLFSEMREADRTSFGWDYWIAWIPLSPYRRTSSRSVTRSEPERNVCPRCFMEMPAIGGCHCQA